MKVLFTLCLSFLAILSFTQSKEGVVTYESVMKIDVSRFPPEVKAMIPSERKSKNQLFFTEKEAIYKTLAEEADTNKELTASNGNQVRFRRMGGSEREVYTNLEDGSVTDKSDLFGKTFLIAGSEPIEWKMTSEVKMIAGYQCMKATYMRDTVPVAAWFAPQIPLSLGPNEYAGLPGLVLSVDINDGQRTIVATNVDLRTLSAEELIIAPDKGKKVTREEFRKIQKEKMEEMREMNGGGGRGAVFIERH